MSRLSSAFETPPEPGSMLAHLENRALESPFTAKMAIVLANEDATGVGAAFPDIEPLPHIDYLLVHTLITLAGRRDKRELKPFDYLIDARKWYYNSHAYFRAAFVCLQDTQAYGQMLEEKIMKLAKLGSTVAQELETTQIALQKNYRDLAHCLNEVEFRHKRREVITTRFSKMKYCFVESQMPRLIYIGKKAYLRAMQLKSQPTLRIRPVAPVQPRITQTAVAPHQFESLSHLLNADMSVEDLLQAASRIDNHAQQAPNSHPDARSRPILQAPFAPIQPHLILRSNC